VSEGFIGRSASEEYFRGVCPGRGGQVGRPGQSAPFQAALPPFVRASVHHVARAAYFPIFKNLPFCVRSFAGKFRFSEQRGGKKVVFFNHFSAGVSVGRRGGSPLFTAGFARTKCVSRRVRWSARAFRPLLFEPI